MRTSKVLARLRADKPVLMASMSLGVNTIGTELAGRLGYHAVWLDMEHRSFTWRDMESLIMAARLGETDAVVRIRKQEGYATFMRPLQEGAAGLMIPHVRSAKEATQCVEFAKYPPVGRRGLETVMRDAAMGLADVGEYIKHANKETFLVLQIEDVEAVEAADEIIAVPGFDVVFVGPADLANGYGVAGQMRHPKVMAAITKIAELCARHGKWWGLPVPNMEDAKEMVALGGRFFNFVSDYGSIRSELQRVRNDFNQIFGLDS